MPEDAPPLPVPDEASTTADELRAFSDASLVQYRAGLVECPHAGCDRTFGADYILRHAKGCDKRPLEDMDNFRDCAMASPAGLKTP